jgi:hypothetical protein
MEARVKEEDIEDLITLPLVIVLSVITAVIAIGLVAILIDMGVL